MNKFLKNKKVKELKKLCKNNKIQKYSKKNKKELIKLLQKKINFDEKALIIQNFVKERILNVNKQIKIIQNFVKKHIFINRNKGKGAGGKNTNINGLNYEKITNLILYKDDITFISNQSFGKNKNDNYDIFEIKNNIFYRFMKKGLKNYFIKTFQNQFHKNLEPDESLFHKNKNRLFIIEKKFQNVSGSVDEKIQTGPCKLFMYSKLYPDLEIKYIYLLSDWFLQNKYDLEKEYLDLHKIKYFFPSDKNYISKFVNYLLH